MTGGFKGLGGRRDILSRVLQVLENTIPDPMGGFDHLPPNPVAVFIRLADPKRRVNGSLVLHETTVSPPHGCSLRKDYYSQYNKESSKPVNLKIFLSLV